jgi:5,6-dimethylbenzimidazole synthase
MSTPEHRFSDSERRGLYRAMRERRDVRAHFLPEPIAPEVLARLLQAAHYAPSVGFMQPWDFIVIDSPTVKQAVKALFTQENQRAAANYEGERAALYRRLKLEGILESPINLCVTSHRSRGGPHVLGRNTILETDLFSVCLAVQNLWLAARAEGIGVGWVSILEPQQLTTILKLPADVVPVAYLCLGYVSEFLPLPELERQGWRARLPLHELVHGNAWGSPVLDAALAAALQSGEGLTTRPDSASLGAPGSSPAPEATLERGAPRDNPGALYTTDS